MHLKYRPEVFLIWLMAVSLCSAVMGPISSVVTDNPEGSPPYNLQSVTVGSYTVDRSQLASGTSTRTLAFDPDNPIPELDDLDLSFAWSNGETGNEFTVHMFNGELWRNSNGDDPDFFLFEAGTGDGSEVAAILPGGVIGQSVTLSGGWGSTGHNSNGQSIDGNSTGNGQSIVGICWAITDLLDDNGNALTNDSIIEGIAVTSRNGMDPADWFAVIGRPYQAREPHPEDKATDVIRDIILTWEPGWSASQHVVYFGTDFDDVNNGADSVKVGPAQDALSYDPSGLLDFGQTYYWRVDEVNGIDVWKGEVWQFEVEPYAYSLENVTARASSSTTAKGMTPDKTVDGSGMTGDEHSTDEDTMWLSAPVATLPAWIQYEFDGVYKLSELWVWNSNQAVEGFIGFGAREVTVEYSLDGVEWSSLGDVEFAQAPGDVGYTHNTEVDLAGVQAKFVRLTIASNWKGIVQQVGLSEVRFHYVPVKAREPQPDNGATGVDPDVLLGWRSGRMAVSHTLTLSTYPETVIETTDSTYDTTALDLQLGESYSWVVTDVNEAAIPSAWEGDVWTFTIAEPWVFDDMESYQDKDSFWIWETWRDGTEYGTNDPDNGSLVGADPSRGEWGVETGLGRGKSLPIWFDNTTVSYSEATRFVDNEDWTRHGIESLSLYFRKGADNTGGGQVYVKINDKEVVYQGPADVPPGWQTDQWIHWIIDLSAVGTDLTNVTKIMVGVKGANAKGVLYVDDIAFYKHTPASEQVVSWFEAESGTLGPTMLLFDDFGSLGASGGQFIGTEDGSGEDTANVQDDGIATYSFTVNQAGVYKLAIRAGDFGGNSFWFRIPGSVISTTGNEDNLGWIAYNFYVFGGTDTLGWITVTDYDDGNQVVEFTLAAGEHTLEIGRREDGAFLDAIAIVSVTE